MNKRDVIRIVFRIAAIIIIFIQVLPELYINIHEGIAVYNHAGVASAYLWTALDFILSAIFPLIISLLLWNKTEWLSKKIFTYTENFDNSLSSKEFESVLFSSIGIIIIAIALHTVILPIESILRYAYFSWDMVFQAHIIPLFKLTFGIWLIMRSRKRFSLA